MLNGIFITESADPQIRENKWASNETMKKRQHPPPTPHTHSIYLIYIVMFNKLLYISGIHFQNLMMKRRLKISEDGFPRKFKI